MSLTPSLQTASSSATRWVALVFGLILLSGFLQAISVAAVFFGAMSYIGNAPNFMVKAIAEANGVETPSFMAYIVKYSIPILIPVYAVIYIIFYSGWVL